MSNITDSEIRKLAEKEYRYFNHLATDRIVDAARLAFVKGYKAALQNKVSDEEKDIIIKLKDNYIKELDELLESRASEIRHLQSCLNKHQNKVSDISAEEVQTPIRDSLYATGKFTTDDCDILSEGILQYIKDAKLKIVQQEYASIVNENKDIDEECLKITGHNSPKEMIAYEKGREDEQQVIMKWIEQWDGSTNSVMGALLKKKFDEREDSGAIEFAEWLRKNNMSHNGFGGWGGGKINVNFYGSKTTDLYKLFHESQPK